ncbi:MAG TPA: glycoside hydrolase family 3 N-terminal domain-containing protein [Burkholderiales bacterium]|nr:glycoside hydrolase family 3 N-terminal domain-containing protein [Burkholderiales bacterium]
MLSYKGLTPDAELLGWARQGLLAGVVLFRDNCVDEALLRQSIDYLRTVSPRRLRVMIDEEGGRVRRLPDAEASMRDLRAYEGAAYADLAAAYAEVARRLAALGIDTLLAPVVDVGHRDAGWLNSRTVSDDPHRVAQMAAAVIPAVQSAGVSACAKHFPGSGRVRLDPHQGPAVCAINGEEFRACERVPFDAAIAAGVEMVLVGHQVMTGFHDELPACLSRRIVTELLREQLAFGGEILTDDLSMGAIRHAFRPSESVARALEAGCDLILVCNDRDAQREAIDYIRRRGAIL